MTRGPAIPRTAALLLLAAVSAAVWVHRIEINRPTRLGGVEGDTFRYFYPAAVYLHEELRQARLPLWNPYQLAGQPYLALHVPGVLYPPNLVLFTLASPSTAMALHAVLHLFAAGLFTWLFAGRLGLGPAARLTAALGFMLCRSLLLGLYMPPFLSTPSWFPALLWTLHGLASEARPRWAVGLAVFLSLSFLGGSSQAFVCEVQFAAVYGIFGLLFLAPRGGRGRVVALAALAGLLSAGFAAPQLLPALELVRDGVRGLHGIPFRLASLTLVQPPMLLKGLLGGLAPGSLGTGQPLVTVPILTLPLAACGLLARRQRAHWLFFLGAAVLCGLFLLGGRSFVFRLYYELPLGNLFRVPSRVAFLYTFQASLLAALGVQGMEDHLRRRPRSRWLPVAAASALALLVGADAYQRTGFENRHPVLALPLRGAPAELIAFLQENAGFQRVFVHGAGFADFSTLYKLGMMNGTFAVPDYEPNMPGDYQRYFRAGRPNHPWHGELFVSPAVGRAAPSLLASPRLLDLMSVRYYALRRHARPKIVSDVRAVAGDPIAEFEGVHLMERQDALPRAYAVRRVLHEPTLDDALRRLEDEAFRPREEAVVVDAQATPSRPAPAAPSEETDAAEIVSYEPDRVEIAAHCRADCLVVLTDLHYPGWRVRVDGREKIVERANGIFRGVWLEPGRHRVVYRYRPASFRWGVALLALASLTAAAALSYPLRRKAHGP